MSNEAEAADQNSIDTIDDTRPPLNERPSKNHFSPSLLGICQAIASDLEFGRVLETILKLTLSEMRAQEGSILLFDEKSDQLKMLAAIGLPKEIMERGYLPRAGSIAEWVVQNRTPKILNGRISAKNFNAVNPERFIVSSMCVPLRTRGKVLGTINLNRTNPELPPFNKDDLNTMVIIAAQAAISIENSRLLDQFVQRERLAGIGQTVSGIAHCMKNLITSLKGGLSVCEMAQTKRDWDMLFQGFDVLKRANERISSLALDMLEYSKEREQESKPVDIAGLLIEVQALTRDHAAQKDNAVQIECESGAESALGDSHQLFRCVLNLVDNAIDASPPGGKVTLRASREDTPAARGRLRDRIGEVIVIRVSDTGPGISEENRARLFEPFFSTKGSRGTGLGLAVSHKIIRDHGGALELESPPGQPAVFAIYLPHG